MVRAAVVGVGLFGQNHARAYSQYHRSRLVCVCDTDAERAKAVAATYRCDYTTNVSEVACSSLIDVVSVATPDFAHLDPCLALAEGGKHLLVEKPLAMSSADATRIRDAAASRGLKLMVDFHNRWNPPFVRAKEEILAGRLGEPVTGYARLSNPLSVPLEMLSWSGRSGPQWFLMPHTLDLVRWLLGREAESVYAVGHRGVLSSKGVDSWDSIQAMVRFGDACVTFESSWILPNSHPSVIDFQVSLLGTQGKLRAILDETGLEVEAERFGYADFGGSRLSHGRWEGFIYEPIRHFVDCVADDRTPDVTADDGIAATATIEAILRSLASGSPEPVQVPH
jgi:predicted dehydrogenase